jgi:acetyl/propionyl-CoA carboxylase alpha subunit
LAELVGYRSAGTVEYLFDNDKVGKKNAAFYLLSVSKAPHLF